MIHCLCGQFTGAKKNGLYLLENTAQGNCALLGYYAVSSSNFLPTVRYNLSVPSSRVSLPPEDENDMLS